MNDLILSLRVKGYSISNIQALTGLSLTHICEVIYEQNQDDITNDGLVNDSGC